MRTNYLIPPRSVTETEGSMSLDGELEIASVHGEDRTPVLGLLADLARLGVRGRLTGDTTRARVILVRDKSVQHPEGYTLSVAKNRVMIRAATPAGTYYAVQTLRELIAVHGTALPCVDIHDEPRFARRGYYLDCSRGKVPTVRTVVELAERLAHWKINELQLYIENVFTFAKHPRIGEGYSPYTPADIAAMQEHCRLHHIRLVPSLTSLGHFEKILMLPEYQDLGELPGFRDLPGGTTLYPGDPRSVELVGDMYREFLPLFDAEDFNACGDEPWELGQGRSKERAEAQGVGRVYIDFIMELRKLSVAHGKRLNIWGDIVLKHPEIIPEIPPEVVLLNWDYRPDGHMMLRTDEFSAAGLPLVCCPGTHGWQSHGTRLSMSMQDIHQFAKIASEHGAEGILNTDWGDIGHRNALGVSLHGAAYGAACSWNVDAAPGPGSDEFTRRFARHAFGDESISTVLTTIGDEVYGYWAYHVVLESLRGPLGFGEGFSRARPMIDGVEATDEELWAAIERSEALAIPEQSEGLMQFEALALSEYGLAATMNAAAARRVLLARAVRGGKLADRAELERNRDELAAIRQSLASLWSARSRPSRLVDSLAGFDSAVAEVDELLG